VGFLFKQPHCAKNILQGTLAQLVEQWTENPCVPGSIPGGTTKPTHTEWVFAFYIAIFCLKIKQRLKIRKALINNLAINNLALPLHAF
jgi:hypothetical protein